MTSCANLLNSGSCNDSGCTDSHTLACDPCKFVAQNASEFRLHFKSTGHKRTVTPASAQAPTQPPTRHSQREKHNSAAKIYKAAIDEAEKDKNGVKVEGDVDFGIVEQHVAGAGLEKRISISVAADASGVRIICARVKQSVSPVPSRRSPPSFAVTLEGEKQNLSATNPTTVIVTFNRKDIGRFLDRLELEFEDLATKKRFVISRLVKIIVGEPALHDQLKAKAPYVPKNSAKREPETNVVKGVKPPALKTISYASVLPRSEISAPLLSTLTQSSTSTPLNIKIIRTQFLPKKLDIGSHGQHFKILMWIEEHRMEHDLERYDATNSTLAQNLPYYYLEVPGLAEKRPSVLIGDRILARKDSDPAGHWYAGHVHFVRQYEVGLRFHQSFDNWSAPQKYHIRFKLSRIPLRRQHQALDAKFDQPRILFPTLEHLPKKSWDIGPDIKPFNEMISNNPNQLQAIKAITAAPPGHLPFIVFGPPGTGKTMTIVEAIKQLAKTKPNARILACAPSNAAGDLIAMRLRDSFGIDELFRLYAPSRLKIQVPDELFDYTYYHEMANSRPCFGAPSMGRLKRFKVIVTTCISSSIISGVGMSPGHFTHIFVDEAGQATEPEALVPIKMLADKATNIVLSGDPKQLGPIVRSGIASNLGLELSFLERLMQYPPYDLEMYSGKSIVKLVKNYRSHNAILKFPNDRFYCGDLEARAGKIVNSYLRSPWLPNGDFPVVFHSVSGKDDREASSPSFFNIDEVIMVKQYIQQLKADRRFRTNDSDIGVITPYHAHCQKMRSALRNIADEVKVASVEDFQGQERKIIIVSTVRSSKEFISYDIRHTLGFVASPRRFNVAMTRAQALLIVVGDPQVLGLDPLWRSFLNYVHDNGGWRGPDIPWDPSARVNEVGGYDVAIRDAASCDMNDLTRQLEVLALEDLEDMDTGIDRPWREVE